MTKPEESKTGTHQVTLPNGEKRIEFIRNQYYGEGENKGNRSAIKNDINKMYEDSGDKSGQIPYQIVFSATKTETDPRIAAAKRKTEAATKKAQKEADAKKAEAATAAKDGGAKK